MTIVDENHAPGRKRTVRANGRVNAYWVASPAAVKAGYRPKTVPLNDDRGDNRRDAGDRGQASRPLGGNARVHGRRRARAERRVNRNYRLGRRPLPTDQDSPYRRIRPATRPGYDRALAIVRSTVGERRIDTVTANDVRRWFKNWGRADEDGELANPRRAYWCLQMLRIAVKYGKGLRNAACRELSEILTDTEFPAPRGRRQAMSVEQAAAIVTKAHELGLPNLARAVAMQFGCALRQKDVIGEWVESSRRRAMDERLALRRACQGGLAAREADVEEQFLRGRGIRPATPTDRDGGIAAYAGNEPHRAGDPRRADGQALSPARVRQTLPRDRTGGRRAGHDLEHGRTRRRCHGRLRQGRPRG
jgi:hypothetical protein